MPGTLDRSRTSARPSCGKRKMSGGPARSSLSMSSNTYVNECRVGVIEGESRFKGSRARVLSAALQEHINELQAKVTTPKSSQNYSASTVIPTSHASFCPMDIGMCPPATTYVISYAHTFENHQILQKLQ